MKKLIAIITITLFLVVAFTGCTTRKSTGETSLLESTVTTVEKQTVAEVSPNIFLWMDESTSISEDEKATFNQASKEYIGLKNSYGPYPFGGGTYGDSTSDGWTDLVEPLKASGHNSRVYIFTDGHQENPEGFNQRSFAGPYWGLEVHYVCLEKNGHTEELKKALKNSKEYFKGSTVILEYIDGASRDVIIDEFETQEINVSYEDQDTLYSFSKKESKIPWWIWLLPLLLLIPLLWWLLRRKKDDYVTEVDAGTPAASGATSSVGTPAASGGTSSAETPVDSETSTIARISPVSPTSVGNVEEPEGSTTIVKNLSVELDVVAVIVLIRRRKIIHLR